MTLFSGYDSQALAMERLKSNFGNFDYELVAWCDNDKYAIEAHNLIFPQWKDRNLGDITKVDFNEIPDCDVVTWSFPCTDISSAGKQIGLEQGSGTRSSLGWTAIEIFRAKRPKYLLMENVKPLISQKFIGSFNKMIKTLEEIGYTSYFKVLNSKDYGVPQNRERVFMVSILGDGNEWDNIGKEGFEFPQPIQLKKRISDVLEKDVDRKYFISDKHIDIYSKRFDESKMSLSGCEIIKTGRYMECGHSASSVVSIKGISHTVMENHSLAASVIYEAQDDNFNFEFNNKRYVVRKFTPREFFRLMDVDDIFIDRIQSGNIPNSQQYKLAGNSIVVSCLYYIFKEMLEVN